MKITAPMAFAAMLVTTGLAFSNNATPPPNADAGKTVSLRESAEWTHIWLPDSDKTDKPHVLLVGDSIANDYQGGVARALSGKAYVGYWVSSLCVCDPAYELMLKSVLLQGKFAVIHLNNGLHGVGYTEEQYKAGYEKALTVIKQLQPQAKIIATLSTPLKQESNRAFLNPRIDKRNADVKALAQAAGLAVDDLNTPMQGHPEYYKDPYHYHGNAIAIQASAVAEAVGNAIGQSGSK